MEIYVPRRVIRETRRSIIVEESPNEEELKQRYYEMYSMNRRYYGTFHRFKLATFYSGVMNNFHSFFPRPNKDYGTYKKLVFTVSGAIDMNLREWCERHIATGTAPKGSTPEDWHSPLALSQTGREFLETVDAVIAYNKIPVDLVGQIYEKEYFKCAPMIRASRLIFPAFVHLRALGYSRDELRG